MTSTTRTLGLQVAVVLALGAVMAPAASASGALPDADVIADLRSPDTRDAARPAVVASAAVDLRSPDAADASRPAVVASLAGDLRSPDAADASRPAVVGSLAGDLRSPDAADLSRPAVVESPPVDLRSPDAADPSRSPFSAPRSTVHVADPGFAWGDAGIGAGVAFALLGLTLGTTWLITRRRHRPGVPALRH